MRPAATRRRIADDPVAVAHCDGRHMAARCIDRQNPDHQPGVYPLPDRLDAAARRVVRPGADHDAIKHAFRHHAEDRAGRRPDLRDRAPAERLSSPDGEGIAERQIARVCRRCEQKQRRHDAPTSALDPQIINRPCPIGWFGPPAPPKVAGFQLCVCSKAHVIAPQSAYAQDRRHQSR